MSHPQRPAPRGQRIFISYRRSDCLPQANALHTGLLHNRPNAQVFMDIDSIPPGVDYEEHIRAAIGSCDVVLVLIGDDWLATSGLGRNRRIDEPNDVVRLEIESALASPRVRTIPVLVEGARMPDASQLPESIRRLARINAIELDDNRWQSDLARIKRMLENIESTSQPTPAPPTSHVPPPSGMSYGPGQSVPRFNAPMPPPSYGAPPVAWSPPRPQRPGGPLAHPHMGWLAAVLPIPCCGFFNAVPLVRAGILRRHQPQTMWTLIGTGIGLELIALICFAVIGTAPTDADGDMTGVAGNVSVFILLLATLAAVVLGLIFHAAPTVDLNVLSADAIAKRANIRLDEADQIVAQRGIHGRFATVEQAIAAAEVSQTSAGRLRQVGTVS